MIASESYRGGVGEVRGLVRAVGEVPVRGLPVGDIPGLVVGLVMGDIIGEAVGEGDALSPVPVAEPPTVAEGEGEAVVPVAPVPVRLESSLQAPSKSASPKTPAPNRKGFFILRAPYGKAVQGKPNRFIDRSGYFGQPTPDCESSLLSKDCCWIE